MKKQLCLENIDLGGAVDKFNEELNHAVQDAIERHQLAKERSLTLTVSVRPEVRSLGNGREILQVVVDYNVSKPKLPGSKGVTNKAVVIKGRAMIETADPEGYDVPGQTFVGDSAN